MTRSLTATPATEGDVAVLTAILRRAPNRTRVSLRLVEDDDVSGHIVGSTVVRVQLDDDDAEGHALTIRFPSAAEADAFRRRVILTGAVVAAVILGAGGVALVVGDDAAGNGGSTRIGDVSYHDANPQDGTV